MIYFATMPSPLGSLLLTSDGVHLTGLSLSPHHHDLSLWRRDTARFEDARTQLEQYFAGRRTTFDLSIALAGTPFQQNVWKALRRVPYGTTTSYGDIARRIGHPMAVRAVGLANGRNPMAIIVPCHRVIGSDGSLTGYSGGLARKRWLLRHEGALR